MRTWRGEERSHCSWGIEGRLVICQYFGYNNMKEITSVHGVPVIAASIRLRVGLGGLDMPDEVSFCSSNRVFPYLIVFVGTLASLGNTKEVEA